MKLVLRNLRFEGKTVEGLLMVLLKRDKKKYTGIMHNIIASNKNDINILDVLEANPEFTSKYFEKLDDKCAICHEDLEDHGPVKFLRCEHAFHSECIDLWLQRKAECPLCRESRMRK